MISDFRKAVSGETPQADRKPRAEAVYRRISEACQHLERRAVAESRAVTVHLFATAVGMCVAYPKRQSVRDCYRQLEWTVLQQGGIDLPSESTFRRAVRRERLRRLENLPNTSRSITMSEVEAVLITELVERNRRQRT